MTSAFRPRTDDVEVVTTELHARTESLTALAGLLSDAERQRASRFVFDRDRRRFIVRRAHLRQLLAARLDVRPESVQLIYGVRGKPSIAHGSAQRDLRFNVSSCEDVVVYAFSDELEVGIDVEAVRAIPEADHIAARFFSAEENRAYRALDDAEKPLGFFNCWTRKEAFVKALGSGLDHCLDDFDVTLTPGEPARILRVGNTPGDQCGWYVESVSPLPGFVAAIVCEERTRLV